MTRAEDLMLKGAVALHLAQKLVAFAAYMQVVDLYQSVLKGMNWFGDKLKDSSELAVADCLLGAGAAQAAMGYLPQYTPIHTTKTCIYSAKQQ